jgi:Mce-associated membrane protein
VTDETKNTSADEPTVDESSEAVELTEPVTVDEADHTNEKDIKKDSEKDGAAAEKVTKRVDRTASERTPAHGIRRHIGAMLVAVALIASAGVAGWLYFYQYRVDQQTNAVATNVALDAAKNGTVALLSYSPESLDKDFANAKSNLTGDFLSYYTQFTEQIVTPAAKEKQVKTAASVVRAAVAEMHPDSAVVLLFVNQVTTSKENPDGSFAASSVKVGLKKIDGRWLISAFDPV